MCERERERERESCRERYNSVCEKSESKHTGGILIEICCLQKGKKRATNFFFSFQFLTMVFENRQIYYCIKKLLNAIKIYYS